MLKLDIESLRTAMVEKDLHIPVMSKEIEQFCALGAAACFVDCTIGLGGHASLIAQHLGPQGHIIGIDRDKETLKIAAEKLKAYPVKSTLIHDDFRNIDKILDSINIDQVDGMLFDLGLSSFQLDNSNRGFSFKADGPLDMRINQDSFLTAYDLINSLSENELSLILKNYGEERWHNRIARYLVERRAHSPIQTTSELRETVLRAMPHGRKWQKIDPATRTFQAFRIAVNRELESLEMALQKSPDYLKAHARICVISFHSLEDRIVKHKFRALAERRILNLVVKKPLRPTEEEVRHNARSRSARLRVAEKIN